MRRSHSKHRQDLLIALLVSTIDTAVKNEDSMTLLLTNGTSATLNKKVSTKALDLPFHPPALCIQERDIVSSSELHRSFSDEMFDSEIWWYRPTLQEDHRHPIPDRTPKKISCARFWDLCIERLHNIHQHADKSNEYFQQHIQATQNIEPYPEAPLSTEEPPKHKGKKRKHPTNPVTHIIKEVPHAKKAKTDPPLWQYRSLPFLKFLLVATRSGI
ncbi:hypothetical protein L1887_07275 [Cichorium endivia]|nr:hypothetical protein L1887_07275 [Cichorium endivia]